MKSILILIILGLSLSGCLKNTDIDVVEYATVTELGQCTSTSCVVKVKREGSEIEEYWQAEPAMAGMHLHRSCSIKSNGNKWCFDAHQVMVK